MSLYNSYCCLLSNIYSYNDDYLCKPGQEILFRLGVLSHLACHILKVHGLCGYDYGESPGYIPLIQMDQ